MGKIHCGSVLLRLPEALSFALKGLEVIHHVLFVLLLPPRPDELDAPHLNKNSRMDYTFK